MKKYNQMSKQEKKTWNALQEIFFTIRYALKAHDNGDLTRSEVVKEVRDVMIIHHFVGDPVI